MNFKETLKETTANRAAILEILQGKQPIILNLLELNGLSFNEDALDENDEPVKVYIGLPLFGENLFYSETAHGSGVFEFRYFMPEVCPDTWLRDLPDSHFWNAADCILQALTALREKLYEARARQGSIVVRLDEILWVGLGPSTVGEGDEPETVEKATKAVSHAASV